MPNPPCCCQIHLGISHAVILFVRHVDNADVRLVKSCFEQLLAGVQAEVEVKR